MMIRPMRPMTIPATCPPDKVLPVDRKKGDRRFSHCKVYFKHSERREAKMLGRHHNTTKKHNNRDLNHPTETVTCHAGECGIACWLDRRTRDRKIASSNPGRSGVRIFFTGVSFVC